VQLAVTHPVRVTAAMAPISSMMLEVLDEAVTVGAIARQDTRRAASLIQQTVMYSWFGNRIVEDRRMRVSAEDTWDFLLRGLEG
jgi:hypothetical protein